MNLLFSIIPIFYYNKYYLIFNYKVKEEDNDNNI